MVPPPIQYDASNNSSSGRARSKHSFKPVSRAIRPNPVMNKTAEKADVKLSFGEDFVLEHSFPGLPVTLIAMSGDAPNPRKDLQYSPQAFGFPC